MADISINAILLSQVEGKRGNAYLKMVDLDTGSVLEIGLPAILAPEAFNRAPGVFVLSEVEFKQGKTGLYMAAGGIHNGKAARSASA